MSIKAENVSMTYSGMTGKVTALTDLNLELAQGEFVSIIGPSGCGKTTLMNILAGFLMPTKGRVLVDGREVTGPGPDRCVVFQQYAVFPWLTVRQNVAFGLTLAANFKPQKDRDEIVDHFLSVVGLMDFQNSFPKELSGGMKQRLAIARAYAVNPALLLMDEPFGALDAQTRQFMQESLLEIWQKNKKTVVFITHGVEEAIFLSSRIVIMTTRPGRVREVVPTNLPYPRTADIKTSPEFIQIRMVIDKIVREEFLKQSNTM